MWSKLYYQHHDSSLQCHMIIQKSFSYAHLLLKKHVLLLSIMKTVVLFNVCIETDILFLKDSLINRKIKRTEFFWNIYFFVIL